MFLTLTRRIIGEEMDNTKTLQRNIIIYSIFSACIIALIMAIGFKEDAVRLILGLILGLSISTLNFIELANTLTRSVTMRPDKAQSFTIKKYFVRYIINGVAIYVAVVTPHIHVIGAVIGMLLIKIVIIVTNLFSDKQFYLNIIKRKEV